VTGWDVPRQARIRASLPGLDAQNIPIWRGASSHVHKAADEQNGGYLRGGID
jgi:hypothetical protein